MLNLDETVKISDGVFLEKINDNEMVAINVITGVFVSIDEIAMQILRYIKEPHCLNDIIEMIKEEYDCAEDITEDITELIHRAIEEGVAERI